MHVALALSGGGFKSVADQSGMAAGLLAVLMQRNPDLLSHTSPLASSELFGDVRTITSISGGSWFSTSLVYSESFRVMIEDLARAGALSKESNDIFNSRYSKRFNDLAENAKHDELPKFIAQIKNAGEFIHRGDIPEEIEFGLLMAAYLYQQNNQQVSWSTFVDYILMFDAGKTLGSPVQEWSVGKALAIVTSIITPLPSRIRAPFDRDYIWFKYDGNNILDIFKRNYLFYNVNQPKNNQAFFIPARFSIILGSAASTPSPLPYGPSMLDSMEVNYTGVSSHEKRWNLPHNFAANSNSGMMAKHSEHHCFHDTPLCGSVAASSAAVGILTVSAHLARHCDRIQLDPGVWFGSNLYGEEAFDGPKNLTDTLWKEKKLTQHMVEQVASMGMYELTDGGPTDAFGIATALAAGATDVFTVNSMSSGFSIDCHFSGYQYAKNGILANLSKGLRKNCWPINLWRLFSENQSYYNKGKRKFKKFRTREYMENEVKSTSCLMELSFGSMKVTTVKNEYFGIEGGRSVNLHLFLASGNVTLGINQLFDNYGFYVQDIIAALTSELNKDITNEMLDALVGKKVIDSV